MSNRRRGLPGLLILMTLLLMMIMLAACATKTSVNDYCKIARRISWHADDTEITRQQIHEHNARYMCVCENICP